MLLLRYKYLYRLEVDARGAQNQFKYALYKFCVSFNAATTAACVKLITF
jgi:hypothetical protein